MLFLDPKKADSSLPSVAQNDTSKIVCTSILKTTPLKQKKLEWATRRFRTVPHICRSQQMWDFDSPCPMRFRTGG
jgi:hypothetical protein